MKFFHLIPITILLAACNAVNEVVDADPASQKRYSAQGVLTQTSSYCGGVHPTWEEEMEYQKARPFNTWLYVRQGKINKEDSPILDSVKTDGTGKFTFFLSPGEYVILTPEQRTKEVLSRYKKMESNDLIVDDLCLNGWWKAGLFQIVVNDSSITGLDYNFHYRCFVTVAMPCMSYTGPYPP